MKRKTGRRVYSAAERQMVRAYYSLIGGTGLARELGRSKKAINSLAIRMGIRRREMSTVPVHNYADKSNNHAHPA